MYRKEQVVLVSQKNMNLFEYAHVKLARFLLICFGVWPYQSKYTKHRNYLIFAIWSACILIPMGQSLIETPNMDIQISFGTIVGMTWMLGSLALGTMLYTRPCRLISLGQQIISDYKLIHDPNELAIMEKFFREGKTLTFIYTGSVLTAVTLFLVFHYMPVAIGNAEKSAIMVSSYSSHWVIRDDLRKFQVVIHIGLELLYGTMLYIAVMAVYMCGVKHTCGMNAIVSYRLQKLMDKNEFDKASSKKSKGDERIIRELLDIIEKHRSAIKCAHIVSRLFSRAFYISHLGVLVCLAIFYFGLRYSVSISDNLLTLKVLCLMCIFMEHVFYLNYGGELIIGYSNKVFKSTHYMNWYLMSPKVRRLLLIVILRSSKSEKLTASTMTLSLEYLSKIIQISWSLATVLASTQKNRVIKE